MQPCSIWLSDHCQLDLNRILSTCIVLFASVFGASLEERVFTGRHPVEMPEFAAPVENLTIPVGREATLSCIVNNLGEYKVGWLRASDQTILTLHNRVVTHSTRVSVSYDNHRIWTLHIRQVKESDRGCYMCQVNTSIMKKQIGCIDVHVPPDILSNETSSDLSVKEGENATLACRAIGHPPPRIIWRREDGEPMLLRKNIRDLAKVEMSSGSNLHLWRVDRRQMGAFLCIASNDVPPAVSKRIILSVNFAPIIKIPNQLLGAPFGTDVHLECYAEAYPNTINYWIKNRGEMLLDGQKYSIRENRSAYKVYMSLLIRDFNLSDVGTYNCVSTNSLGRSEGTVRLYSLSGESGSGSSSSSSDGQRDSEISVKSSSSRSCNNQSIYPLTLCIILFAAASQIAVVGR